MGFWKILDFDPKKGYFWPLFRVILVKSEKQPQKWIPWPKKHIFRGVTLVSEQNFAISKIFSKMSKFKMAAISIAYKKVAQGLAIGNIRFWDLQTLYIHKMQ